MKQISVKLCILFLTVLCVNGRELNPQTGEDSLSFYPLFIQKMVYMTLEAKKHNAIDLAHENDLEHHTVDKKPQDLMNMDLDQLKNDEPLNLFNINENNGNSNGNFIDARAVISAPVHCPWGYKFDKLRKCRKTL